MADDDFASWNRVHHLTGRLDDARVTNVASCVQSLLSPVSRHIDQRHRIAIFAECLTEFFERPGSMIDTVQKNKRGTMFLPLAHREAGFGQWGCLSCHGYAAGKKHEERNDDGAERVRSHELRLLLLEVRNQLIELLFPSCFERFRLRRFPCYQTRDLR